MSDSLGMDDAPQMWDRLSECVESFVAAWDDAPEPPSLPAFLPASPAALRKLAAIELVKVDLDYRFRLARQPMPLEDYARKLPELAQGGLACDLIYEEYHVRKQAGEAVTPEEYFRRFPAQADELRRLLGLEAPHLSTAMIGADSIEQFDAGHSIGDFDLLRRLGRGAFASVFLARQKSMQRIVALKISADKGNEPQTLGQLDHPNIVRVYDQHRLPERNLRLLYMQYLPGATLQAVQERVRATLPAERSGRTLLAVIDDALAQHGEVPPTDSLTRARLANFRWAEVVCLLGARLAHALAYAHQRGVLHRDIKPANVLVAADASPKLVDFNISFSSKLEGATPAAYFGGSLAYMSPEQLEACNPCHPRTPADLNGQSDVYSLAVMLWELLAGKRPFRDEQMSDGWSATLDRMIDDRRAGIDTHADRQLPRDLPRGLREALLKALEPDQADRFADAAQFARELELCLQPEAHRLLRPARRGWREMVRRHPFVSLALAGVFPNAVFSVFNYSYNLQGIIARLAAAAQDSFRQEQVLLVNGSVYTVAIAMCVWVSWPVLRAVSRGNALPDDPMRRTQLLDRALYLGDAIAWISFGGWVLSGFMFPLGLRDSFGARETLHFMTSQVLCGLMSTALCFFCVTFLVVRVVQPALLQQQAPRPETVDALARLARRVWLYFGLAVTAPFLSVMALVLIENQMQGAFGALGLVGLAGFGLAFRLALAIRSDLDAMAAALGPAADTVLASSGSADSLLSGSRRHL